MTHLAGKFVWFEHASADIPKARAFYEALLGWHTESMSIGDQRYSMILNGNEGIGGYGNAPVGVPARWMSYLSVPDVDAAHKVALAVGARSLTAPMDFGPVGRGAQLADPTGATFWLWKGADGDRPDKPAAVSGDWIWNELMTPDENKALAFYERVFGYTRDSMDMGGGHTYHLLKKNGVPRCGVMHANEPGAPPSWLPYVAVDDCDATAAKAESLGATVVQPPTDIPNVGRFSVLIDPQGAAIAVMKDAMPAA
jgi:predicted enzyme related to lactoylglutathione lyase